ncbi:hypothetical protein V6N11_071498 [Hibiscus sabdariffa]|uniref:Retrotransposon gag domain-containing protein n=1 Tax=Hibiscus sabdariffa TaxID=183260 RepID=A0ABR2U0T2_9ROSI
MTRSLPGNLVYELEIESLARRLRGDTLRRRRQQPKSKIPAFEVGSYTDEIFSFEDDIANEDQTIRELVAAPDDQQPLCITFPNGETPFFLKTGLIHLLSTFCGLPNENPHKHLKEFHMVCLSTKPQGVSDDQIKLCAFPFSLAGSAKDWLFDLPSNSVTTWTEMARLFLDREWRSMAPTTAINLISSMATNSQQFRSSSKPSRRVHEVSTVSLESKIDKLVEIVQSLIVDRQGKARLCGICTMFGHPTDCCPMLQEDATPQVNAVENVPGPSQRPFNPYGNTYNPGWKDHPNFSYAQNQRPNQAYQQMPPQQPQKPSLESMMGKFIASQEKFQSWTETHL